MKLLIFLLVFLPSIGYSSSIEADFYACMLNSWQCEKVDKHLAYLREGIVDGRLKNGSPEVQEGSRLVKHYIAYNNFWKGLGLK